MQNRASVIAALIVAVLAIVGAWYETRQPASTSAPITATSTGQISTSTSGSVATSSTSTASKPVSTGNAKVSLPFSVKDGPVRMSFKGPYQDGGSLEAKANAQIVSLKAKINESNPQVQVTYIGIAQQYELLGDGQNAYAYFLKALNSSQRYIQEDGLAWAGLGDLMAKLGAKYTAATAYANAVASLPSEPSFHVARLNFLIDNLPNETALINAAFADAAKDVPNDPSVAQIKAQYQAR